MTPAQRRRLSQGPYPIGLGPHSPLETWPQPDSSWSLEAFTFEMNRANRQQEYDLWWDPLLAQGFREVTDLGTCGEEGLVFVHPDGRKAIATAKKD